jgi:membrane protein
LTRPPALSYGIVLFLLTLVGFAVVYRVLARKKPAWRMVWLGALVAALLFSLGRWFFGWYLQLSNFGSVYATAGVLAVILLAVYYAAIIFLVGAMIIRVVPDTFAKLESKGDSSTLIKS